jgi:CheY-like chemotaxis protein
MTAPSRRLQILSSEDDPGVRTILARLLTGEGHEVEFAGNSEALFKLLGKRTWDLVILDVNVPGMNGYQIAQEICSRYTDNRPKMLLFTGRDMQAEKAQVTLSGVDAVLEKGTPLPLLIETVNRLTGLSGAPAVVTAEVSPEEFDWPKMSGCADLNENAPVSTDIEALQKRVADLEKLLRGAQKETGNMRARATRLVAWIAAIVTLIAVLGAAFGLVLLLGKR